MPQDSIKCPKCGEVIHLTEALTAPIETRLREKIEAGVAKRATELQRREAALKRKEGAFDESVQKEVNSRLPGLRETLQKQVSAEFDQRLKQVEDERNLARTRAERAEREERELRKRQEEVDGRAKTLDLEVARAVAAAIKSKETEVKGAAKEELRLKEQEWQNTVGGLQRQVQDLEQRLAQGPVQAQGEALEVALEEELRAAFPSDIIEPVPAGTRGADLVQRVVSPGGQPCGVIVWETKRTKDWSDGWIQKLREDTLRLKGDASVLISKSLPEGVTTISFDRGVVVSSFACALAVATLVRLRFLEVARQRRVDETSTETREVLYRYLTSREFVARVEGMVGPIIEMKQDLDSEVRAIELRWRKRRKEIERAERAMVGMYGDLQGILGRARLPEISRLALPPSDSEADDRTANSKEQ